MRCLDESDAQRQQRADHAGWRALSLDAVNGDVGDGKPLGAITIEGVVGGVADREPVNEFVVTGNLEFLAHGLRPHCHGALRAGSEASRLGAQHEVLGEEAHVRDRVHAQALVSKEEDLDWRPEELVVSGRVSIAPSHIVARNSHHGIQFRADLAATPVKLLGVGAQHPVVADGPRPGPEQ